MSTDHSQTMVRGSDEYVNTIYQRVANAYDLPGSTIVEQPRFRWPQWAGLANRLVVAMRRRWLRERRRRAVGRAYDMALEIARVIPRGSRVLDVGCGNGFIAHHLSGILGQDAVGIDLAERTQAPIDYRRYRGVEFPVQDHSFDAVLLCYVLHHAQDVALVLGEIARALRIGGHLIVYEDIPQRLWDRAVCRLHDLQWRSRTGPCIFRRPAQWCELFASIGFAVVSERRLSRWRNLSHPVSRRFYLLKFIATS